MRCFTKPVTQRFSRISVFVMVALLATSCSESKVSQCSKLIDIANQAVLSVKQVSANPNPESSIKQMNEIADVANKAKAEMEALQIVDDQLKGYQTRFITMYTDTNQATRDLVATAEAKDVQAARAAFTALQEATAQEEPLVNAVNEYCEVQPSPGSSPLVIPTPVEPSVSPSATP